MLSFRYFAALLLSASIVVPSAFASHVHRSPTSGRYRTHKGHHLKHARLSLHRQRGQQFIDPERVTQIQQALIREHYLTGDPSGKWDATTVTAMQKLQADNGWQTKLTPDSRALMKLGLGPDYSTAINAKGSNFAPQTNSDSETNSDDSGFVEASGVSQ
ncbi:MAG: peptidoglycan-binding protein [Terracidiphilus sp.]